MKKAQGLPITTVILAILGILILFIMMGMLTGKIQWAGKGLQQVSGEHPDVIAACKEEANMKDYGEACPKGYEVLYRVPEMPVGKYCCLPPEVAKKAAAKQ